MKNNVSINISAQDQLDISAAITTLNTKLKPHLMAMTDEERIGNVRLGDKSVAFVQKAGIYGKQFSTQMPAYIDLAAFQTDIDMVKLFDDYLANIAALKRGLEDTLILGGNEAMEAANMVYAALKLANQNQIPGSQEAVNDMKARYAKRGKTTAITATTTNTQ